MKTVRAVKSCIMLQPVTLQGLTLPSYVTQAKLFLYRQAESLLF